MAPPPLPVRYRILALLTALGAQARLFLQTRWKTHGHRLKIPGGTLALRAAGAFLLVCLLVYGCHQSSHQHAEKVRIKAVRRAEKQRRETARVQAKEAAREERARVQEQAWQQYARENSNHPVTYQLVYTSRIWIPILGVVALVYALASRAYLFMGISKILLLLLLLTSLALLIGDAVPFVAEWDFFTQFKGVIIEIAKRLNVPVAPPLWLAVSLVGGVAVEGLSRLGSRSKIIVKPANVVVNVPK